MMQNILIIAFSDLRQDARVSRQVDFLKANFNITVVCFDAYENNGYSILLIKRTQLNLLQKLTTSLLLLIRLYTLAYRILNDTSQIINVLKNRSFDLVIANDIESLPVACEETKAKVLFDAHEYAPLQFEDKVLWRILFQGYNKYLCRRYIPKVNAMITVGKGLATAYRKNYGIEPFIITNAPHFYDLQPSQVVDSQIRMIHHGGANRSRKLELMIDMMDQLDDRFVLDLILISPPRANKATRSYIDDLRKRASHNPRVRFLPTLKLDEIIPFINQYDLGVFLIPPVNFNYQNTLPNKFFDYIQARLAIAIGPTPEMAELVQNYRLGVVSDTFTPESLAKAIRTISIPDLKQYKQNSSIAAREFNADHNKVKLLEIVNRILN